MYIGIKIPFVLVSVTIEQGHSLLTVDYHELFNSFGNAYRLILPYDILLESL